jgi:hypothetical protein
MDQGPLVEERIVDGRRFVERFAADGNPVQAAFWAKAEEEYWFLYVVTEQYERDGPAATYRAVGTSLDKLGASSLSGSEIKAIGPHNPIAKDVLAIVARHPGRLVTGSRTLGSVAFEQTLVYPSRSFTFPQGKSMTSEEIGLEIVRLLNRGPGVLQPSRVTLKDGTAFNGVPFSLDLGPERAVVVRFVADGEPAPRVVRLDEIASIG